MREPGGRRRVKIVCSDFGNYKFDDKITVQ